MSAFYKYRVRCTTDNKDEYWILSEDDPEPTTCPTNTGHTIDATRTAIVQNIDDNTVKIKEEDVPTGGFFQATSIKMVAAVGQTGVYEISWPFPITALTVEFVTDTSHKGDVINMYSGKNTIVGSITANVDQPATWTAQNYVVDDIVAHEGKLYKCILNTVSNEDPTNTTYWEYKTLTLNASSTVFDYAKTGFYINLFDGVNTNDLGRVISLDSGAGTIEMELANVDAFLASSPTYVRLTAAIIKDYIIGNPWEYIIGESKIGGSHLPANTVIRAEYQNNGNTGKELVGRVEYLY